MKIPVSAGDIIDIADVIQHDSSGKPKEQQDHLLCPNLSDKSFVAYGDISTDATQASDPYVLPCTRIDRCTSHCSGLERICPVQSLTGMHRGQAVKVIVQQPSSVNLVEVVGGDIDESDL